MTVKLYLNQKSAQPPKDAITLDSTSTGRSSGNVTKMRDRRGVRAF